MTYLAGSVTSLVNDRNNWQNSSNTWQSRANQAWGSSRVWSSGNSFETDLANMTNDRNTWQANANNVYGPSRVYGSGSSFETLYNNEVSAYNALVNGLNNPEGLQSQGFPFNHGGGGSDAFIGNFTVGRTGHFLFAVVADFSGSPTQNNAYAQLKFSGIQTQTLQANIGSTSGGRNWWIARSWDQDVSAGQLLGLTVNCFVTGGSCTGTINVYAHFVPNAAHHN